VVPDKVFSGVITLVCPGNLPTNTTCTFSSPTVSVSAGTPAPFQVTFQTTGIINPLNSMPPQGRNGWPRFPQSPALRVAGIILILLLLLFLDFLRRASMQPVAESARAARLRLLRRFVPAYAVLAIAAVLLAGCHSSKTNASIGATPAGSTNLVITGNSQNASRGLTITLDVVAQ
jgi:hypothetical protein